MRVLREEPMDWKAKLEGAKIVTLGDVISRN